MSRRSALVAAFVVASALTCPADALVLTALVLAPIAAARIAHAYREARDA